MQVKSADLIIETEPCEGCGGTGEIELLTSVQTCTECIGTGYVATDTVPFIEEGGGTLTIDSDADVEPFWEMLMK